MKKLNRIAALLLAVCLVVPMLASVASAAGGVIYFNDPRTAVGETVDITGTVNVSRGQIAEATVNLTYDTNFLRFVSGAGVTESTKGQLVFTGTGTGKQLEFSLTFIALAEGKTRVEQGETTVLNANGETVDCTPGYSDVRIAAGDPTKIPVEGKEVDVDGVKYLLTEITEGMEPAGFTIGQITYDNEQFSCVNMPKAGLTAVYLTGEDGVGKYWNYSEETQTFTPLTAILISDNTTIYMIPNTSEVIMPDEYQTATLEISDTSYQVWIDPNHDIRYILYAANSQGEKGLYVYDSQDHTYQRMDIPEVKATVNEQGEVIVKKTKWDAVAGFISANLIWVLVGFGCLITVLLAFLIVATIKLHLRDREIDSLYDELGYGYEEAEAPAEAELPVKEAVKEEVPSNTDLQETRIITDGFYTENLEEAVEEDDLAELRADIDSAEEKAPSGFAAYYDDDEYENEEEALEEVTEEVEEEEETEDAEAEDEYEEYEDDEYDEDEYDEYEDDEYEDEDEYDEDEYDEYDEDEYEDDDEYEEDDEEEYEEHSFDPESEINDDTFKMDFIDLD